jgi:hypothetical protein
MVPPMVPPSRPRAAGRARQHWTGHVGPTWCSSGRWPCSPVAALCWARPGPRRGPHAGRAAVCAGAVIGAGSTDFHLAGLRYLDLLIRQPGCELAALNKDLAEAEQWNDTERASRLLAEKDFLVRELAAATGLGGRPRRLGAESERARLNVTRAIRSAIARIRDRAPAAAAYGEPS